MASYATRVRQDIARWIDAGLIDVGTGDKLLADVARRARGGISFGSVLAMMAAALFCAAILIFVAANWDAFPRLVRVGLLFALIAAGYLGGAELISRGNRAFGEGAYLVAATGFGAAIALIAQMYHLSGEEADAILTWCGATMVAAALLRSAPLTVGASLLAIAWVAYLTAESWTLAGIPLGYLLLAALLVGLSLWTRSRAARHLVLLSIPLYGIIVYLRDDNGLVPLLLVAAAAGALAADRFAPEASECVLRLGSGLAVQALIWFLTGIGIFQVAAIETPAFLLPTIICLAGIVAILLFRGREGALLRWLCYAAFVFQLCFVYVVMLGSMLGTAGFFVVGGATLALLAYVIGRLERRMRGPDEPDTPPAPLAAGQGVA